jgi:hypothetical protein
MVDQHHRDRAAHLGDRGGQLGELAGIQPTCRLVEQQQLGLTDERPGKCDSF